MSIKNACGIGCRVWILLSLLAGSALAEETNVPTVVEGDSTNAVVAGPARVSLGVLVGEENQEYRFDGLIPLWAPDDARLFIDIGGSLLEDEEQEVNVGLLARHLLSGEKMIVGASLDYGARWTEENNQFDQLGGGLELMSRRIDVRMHYSYPLTDPKVSSEITQSDTTERVESNRRITTTTTTRFRSYEEALEGFDAEAGVWIPFLEDRAPTALYVGYFDYEGDEGSDVDGIRARVESRLHRQVTFDVGWQELTEEDEDEFFVGVRFYLPWDFWNGLRTGRACEQSGETWSARARLDEIPSRIYRVRTEDTGMVIEQMTESSVAMDTPVRKKICTPALNADGNVIVICK